MLSLMSIRKMLRHLVRHGDLALVMLLSVSVSGLSLPGCLVVELEELPWPSESENELQARHDDRAAWQPQRTKARRSRTGAAVRLLCHQGIGDDAVWRPTAGRSGHRWANGLLAPHQC